MVDLFNKHGGVVHSFDEWFHVVSIFLLASSGQDGFLWTGIRLFGHQKQESLMPKKSIFRGESTKYLAGWWVFVVWTRQAVILYGYGSKLPTPKMDGVPWCSYYINMIISVGHWYHNIHNFEPNRYVYIYIYMPPVGETWLAAKWTRKISDCPS